MQINIFNNESELNRDLWRIIKEISEKAISEHGMFNFVLSGGNTPKSLYKLLASKPYSDEIEWSNTFFFFGDERFVPENDPRRNSLMAQETLLTPLRIPEQNIFLIDTSGSPEEAAKQYETNIREHFGSHPIEFDLVLLGLGDDAHTASLFPGTYALKDTDAGIKSVYVSQQGVNRITMNAPLINQAKNIAFLVTGEKKADAVFHVVQEKEEQEDPSAFYPARLIRRDDSVNWFLDTAAASRLK